MHTSTAIPRKQHSKHFQRRNKHSFEARPESQSEIKTRGRAIKTTAKPGTNQSRRRSSNDREVEDAVRNVPSTNPWAPPQENDVRPYNQPAHTQEDDVRPYNKPAEYLAHESTYLV